MRTYTKQDLINFHNLLTDSGVGYIDETNQERVFEYYKGLTSNNDPLEEFYKTFDIKNIIPQRVQLNGCVK
jgi:hypothetical protein